MDHISAYRAMRKGILSSLSIFHNACHSLRAKAPLGAAAEQKEQESVQATAKETGRRVLRFAFIYLNSLKVSETSSLILIDHLNFNIYVTSSLSYLTSCSTNELQYEELSSVTD